MRPYLACAGAQGGAARCPCAGLAGPDAVSSLVVSVRVCVCFVVASVVQRSRGMELRALLTAAGMYREWRCDSEYELGSGLTSPIYCAGGTIIPRVAVQCAVGGTPARALCLLMC